MQNLFEDLKQLLAQDERLTTEDGKLLKNMIIELGLKLDADYAVSEEDKHLNA